MELPASGRLAWWGTSWLRGHTSADDLLDAVLGDHAVHLVAGLFEAPGPDGEVTAERLLAGLGELRRRGATGLGAAFPAEGSPLGLGGPPALTAAALEAGEAVVVLGLPTEPGVGLVPVVVGAQTTWTAYPARRRQVPDVGEADRGLRAALTTTATALADLDVARWRPEVADALMNLRHRSTPTAPDGVPPRCTDLAGRALQALAIVDLALEDDGGSLGVGDAQARRSALVELGRAGRSALVAACSPEAWPD